MIPIFLILDRFFFWVILLSTSLINFEIVPAMAAGQMVFDTALPGHCQENSLQNPVWFNKIDILNQNRISWISPERSVTTSCHGGADPDDSRI
jgi:hypothetical protein